MAAVAVSGVSTVAAAVACSCLRMICLIHNTRCTRFLFYFLLCTIFIHLTTTKKKHTPKKNKNKCHCIFAQINIRKTAVSRAGEGDGFRKQQRKREIYFSKFAARNETEIRSRTSNFFIFFYFFLFLIYSYSFARGLQRATFCVACFSFLLLLLLLFY